MGIAEDQTRIEAEFQVLPNKQENLRKEANSRTTLYTAPACVIKRERHKLAF